MTDEPEKRDRGVELDEQALDEAAGGASDYLLRLDGVKGESRIATRDTDRTGRLA